METGFLTSRIILFIAFTVDTSCKVCCRNLTSRICSPYEPLIDLADGRSCVQGYCNNVSIIKALRVLMGTAVFNLTSRICSPYQPLIDLADGRSCVQGYCNNVSIIKALRVLMGTAVFNLTSRICSPYQPLIDLADGRSCVQGYCNNVRISTCHNIHRDRLF